MAACNEATKKVDEEIAEEDERDAGRHGPASRACSKPLMPDFAAPLQRLIDEFRRLPGIGQKSAQRLAFHVLRIVARRRRASGHGAARRQGQPGHLRRVQQHQRRASCAPTAAIRIATAPRSAWWKNRTTSCRLRPRARFTGIYHVLHGAISPLRGIGPEQLKIKGLLDRIAQGRSAGNHPGDQSDGRRRSDRGLSFAPAEAAGNEGDAHRHGDSGGQRPGVRRRSDDLEVAGESAGDVGREFHTISHPFSPTRRRTLLLYGSSAQPSALVGQDGNVPSRNCCFPSRAAESNSRDLGTLGDAHANREQEPRSFVAV